jgi:hydroxyacylglutathione hydrolase
MRFNPYGPADKTKLGGKMIRETLAGREITHVCGYNYVVEYAMWRPLFDSLLDG